MANQKGNKGWGRHWKINQQEREYVTPSTGQLKQGAARKAIDDIMEARRLAWELHDLEAYEVDK